MRSMCWLGPFLVLLSFLFSGCGHNGTPAPSAISYANSSAAYVRGVPSRPMLRQADRATSYSVSPALPTGLILNSGTGIISGTPTAVAAQASYTVTATGSGGSITTTLTIRVNDQPPTQFSYAAGTAIYIVNAPITENDPSNAGGVVASYSINPALPAGLSMSTSSGSISGTPAALSPQTKYTVTATNSGGNAMLWYLSPSTLATLRLWRRRRGLSTRPSMPRIPRASRFLSTSQQARVVFPFHTQIRVGIQFRLTAFRPRFPKGCESTAQCLRPLAICPPELSAEHRLPPRRRTVTK